MSTCGPAAAVLGLLEDAGGQPVHTEALEVVLYLERDRSWPEVDLGLPLHHGRQVINTRPL